MSVPTPTQNARTDDPDNCGQPDPLMIENDADAAVPHQHPHPTGKGVLAIDMDDVLW